MTLSLAVAVLVAQTAVAQPQEPVSEHVRSNMRRAASGATAAALVTVSAADAKTAQLHVDQVVLGDLPAEVSVPANAFIKRDLEPGTQLLVFFRGSQRLTATGQYEIVIDGKIREYPSELYLEWTQFEASKLPAAKARPAISVAAPAGASRG